MSNERTPIVSDDELQRIALGYYTKEQVRKSRETQHIYNASYVAAHKLRDIYEAARAKDTEEIAKWKGIVEGVRDALNHIDAAPPRRLDADLYYTVMALRGRDAEMVQMLVRYLFKAMAAISDGEALDCWYVLRDALVAAGYKRTGQ